MKRICIGISCFILCFLLAACGNHLFNIQNGYYSNFTSHGEDTKLQLSGKAQVVNTLHLVSISALEDTSVDLSGELTALSGDVQIVYINSDKKETVIFDSNNDSQQENLKLDTNIKLDKGENLLEFRGKNVTLNLNLLFSNIDTDKFKYFNTNMEDENESEEENFEMDNVNNLNSSDKNILIKSEDKLLNEVSVTYTNKDDNCIVLNTSLDKDTKIKVFVKASVSNIDPKDSLSFGGFHLDYKTESDGDIEVLKYKTNEFALEDYEWQDSFVQEIDLPKGTSELTYNTYKGTNYELTLDIQLIEID